MISAGYPFTEEMFNPLPCSDTSPAKMKHPFPVRLHPEASPVQYATPPGGVAGISEPLP
jgi:hypothetical protein